MPSKAIPIKLKGDVIESIDELVKKGLFHSRNEAIKRILGKGLVTFSNEAGRQKTITTIADRLFLLDRD